MKNKLILLVMTVPIILMFAIFSMTNYVSLKTDVFVAGIKFAMQDYIEIDLANTDNLVLDSIITPANATNKQVEYSFVKQNQSDDIYCDFNQDTVYFTGLGQAQIIVKTIDGGYKDTITVNVTSSKLIDFNIMAPGGEVKVGDKINFEIKTSPLNMNYTKIEWFSSDESKLSISKTSGSALVKDSGDVEVSAKVYDGENVFTDKVTISIQKLNTDSLATINGVQEYSEKTTSNAVSFITKVYLDNFTSSCSIDDFSFNYDVLKVSSLKATPLVKDNIITYNVICELKEDYYGEIKIDLCYLNQEISSISVAKKQYITSDDCSVLGLGDYLSKNPTKNFATGFFSVEHFSSDENYSFKATSKNSNVLEAGAVVGEANSMFYRAKSAGEATITISCYYQSTKLFEFDYTTTVVEVYDDLRFKESTLYNWRLDDYLTIGSKIVKDSQITPNDYTFNIMSTNVEADQSLLKFESLNTDIATIVNDKLHILQNGQATIKITNKYGSLVGNNTASSITLNCVNGVNVYSYSDLCTATESGECIVVMNDIMLGQKLIEKTSTSTNYVNGMNKEKAIQILNNEVKQISTTYDWTYYKNIAEIDGKPITEAPKLNYCIEFKNDVYGNGFTINAEYITNLIDSSNIPLEGVAKFTGPLNLVSIMNAASVKAQDHMAFLIRNDNVTLKNLELKGCDNVDDLTKLNYVGTTLEIMGDNVSLIGCNVQNGRNVVRIFGDYEDKDKQITVNIDKCVLKSAREFLLKIGTNKYILGESDELTSDGFEKASPKLENYEPRIDANLNNSEFAQKYVKTIVNLKNSMLNNSGIFAVGIETKFAGPCLAGRAYGSWDLPKYGWYDLAGTSYASVLNVIGDVRIYDWKKLTSLDSSTLLETVVDDTFDLAFDVQAILKDASQNQNYSNIVTNYNNEEYVHGGIALYGGGKNYSVVRFDKEQDVFDNFTVGFEILTNTRQKNIMEAAAGKEPFRFMMYNNEKFSISKQEQDLQNGSAYSYMNELD